MDFLNVAFRLMSIVHRGQKDEQGVDYVRHTHRVGQAVKHLGPEYEAAGYLHDTVEDTQVTIDDLSILGFPSEVVIAINRLTRHKDENYEDYIRRLADHPIAREVKKADILDNLRLLRPKGCEYMHGRYRIALAYLNQLEE